MSSFTEKISAFAEKLAYPNLETNLGHHEHDAAHGANLVEHEPASGIWGEFFVSSVFLFLFARAFKLTSPSA